MINTTERWKRFRKEYAAAHPGASIKEASRAYRLQYSASLSKDTLKRARAAGEDVKIQGAPEPASDTTPVYSPPPVETAPPPKPVSDSTLQYDAKKIEVRIAPQDVWAMLWDTVYRARAYFQYHHEMWLLTRDESAELGKATQQAWRAYVPAGSLTDQAFEKIWPALALGATMLLVEKAKQEQWAHLLQIYQRGPVVPEQYATQAAKEPPVTPMEERNLWETFVAPREEASVNGGPSSPPPSPAAAVELRETLRQAGVEMPPDGVGLRQAFTRGDLG